MTLLRRLRERFHGSLRFKLLAVALLPLVIALPLLIVLLAVWGNLYYDRLLIAKVRSDLAVAHGYFEQVKEGIGRRVEALAGSERLARTLRERPQAASVLLRDAQATLGVDFLILLDADGRVRAASGASSTGLGYESPLALRPSGHAVTEVDLLSAGQLAAIDPRLAEKARTPLLKTQNALPTQQTEEARGMAIQSLAPVPGGGLLVGGLLLNRNLEFVDRINEIVYPEGALPLGSAGTATLFLDDVRIATNVRLFEGERAIGTRVSAAVRHAVLDQGRTWLDRAFVVNDWYVSAYEPIADGSGKRVGMLYVGYLEAPFLRVGYLALAATMLLFLAAAAAAIYVSLRLARHVSRPVELMHGVMSAIEAGNEEARVGRIVGADELAELGEHFDRLLNRLSDQTEALQRWGHELDSKVAERTAELAAANESLRSAQQRLVMSEKLAAIGQLAAGVAHEMNNPIAVIQGNLDVLREVLGPAAAPAKPEMQLIQDQVFRIRLIVTKLLQFARPGEYGGYLDSLQVDAVVQDSLLLIGHQLRKHGIDVRQSLHARRAVTVSRNELEQVLINLMVNAIQAMSSGGILWIETGDRNEGGVPGAFVAVADNGPGIAEADRARLFDPFFTTKAREGTGLGLWVSLGLVQRYGGRIDVVCPPSGGSVFTVWLPVEPPDPAGPGGLGRP
jgi:signal transduction histidine kinase